MNLEEIVNKAIPLSFPGVKCAATISVETQKAMQRREVLTEQILTLLQNQQNARDNSESGVGDGKPAY
jgi:hypothetical protein